MVNRLIILLFMIPDLKEASAVGFTVGFYQLALL